MVFGKAGGFAANLNLSTLDGSNGFKLSGVAAGDYSGSSVSAAGDVNGDGFGDLIIGAYGADPNGSDSGASYVVFGKAGGFAANLNLSTLDGSNGFKLSGEAAGDHSGSSVSAAGDVNGDGFGDLIIGASGADPNGSYSGASYVVFGKAGGFAANLNLSTLDGSNGFKLNGVRGWRLFRPLGERGGRCQWRRLRRPDHRRCRRRSERLRFRGELRGLRGARTRELCLGRRRSRPKLVQPFELGPRQRVPQRV